MRRIQVGSAAVVAVVAAGCGAGTGQLLHPGTSPRTRTAAPAGRTRTAVPAPSAASVYLARLGTLQSELAAAEQRIPTNPRTPDELARSVDLLSAAVRRLAAGLAALTPPASVAPDHARLVGIMRVYAAQLDQAARIAVTPSGEQAAGSLLIQATDRASRSFSATTTSIDSTLVP